MFTILFRAFIRGCGTWFGSVLFKINAGHSAETLYVVLFNLGALILQGKFWDPGKVFYLPLRWMNPRLAFSSR